METTNATYSLGSRVNMYKAQKDEKCDNFIRSNIGESGVCLKIHQQDEMDKEGLERQDKPRHKYPPRLDYSLLNIEVNTCNHLVILHIKDRP